MYFVLSSPITNVIRLIKTLLRLLVYQPQETSSSISLYKGVVACSVIHRMLPIASCSLKYLLHPHILHLRIGFGDLKSFAQVWVIARQTIIPLIYNVVVFDHEGATKSQYALGDLSELHIGRDRANLHDVAHILPGTSKATQIRCRHFDLLGYFWILLVEPFEPNLFIRAKGVVIDKGL